MSQKYNLKHLAKKAYMSYHQDGIIDLLVGWMIVAFSLNIGFDASSFSYLGWLPIIFYVPLKNRITAPRFGYVKFDSKHGGGQGRMVTAFLVLGLLSLLVLGTLVFLVAGASPPPFVKWVKENTAIFYGIVGAIGFSLPGIITGIRRFNGYALLSLFLAIMGQTLQLSTFWPLLFLGVAVLVSGILHLVRFLKKYPLSDEDEFDVTE